LIELGLQPDRFSQVVARTVLNYQSWRLDFTPPAAKKYVLVGAPHTSGWDFLYTMLLSHAAGIELHWVGKDTLFKRPFGSILRKLGGIPVNRRSRNNFVQQVVDEFNQHSKLVVAIAPEGTRDNVPYWKTGFYYIALGASVPIVLGYIDYAEKTVGIGPTLFPSGDLQADFDQIKSFYAGKLGKHPHRQGKIQLRPTDD
jgi:1-acyl-sn-glycerol-3-phosphate acyltransferase